MASLKDVGQTQMGKTGTVSLSEIGTKGASQGGVDGYDRTFVTAANDYKRVNPYMVDDTKAPDPIGISTPYSLADWDSYSQWDETLARPSSFNCTNITTTGANNSQATFSFNIDAAFTDFDIEVDSDITYTVHVKECGASISNCVDGFGDPIDPSSSPTDTTRQDTSTIATGLLNDGKWFIAGIYVEWDDESVGGFTRISEAGYTASLSNGSGIDDSGTGEEYIRFFTPDWICTLTSNQKTTSTDACFACCGCCPETSYRDGGTTTTGTTYYTTNACTTVISSTFKWIAFASGDSGPAYALTNGEINGTTDACSGCFC